MKRIHNSLKSDLNLNYTLESYIHGENSEFAYNACVAIAKEPGLYNPCFIYGPLGLGKTHLLHAIGNDILKHNDKLKTIYVQGSENPNNSSSWQMAYKRLRLCSG